MEKNAKQRWQFVCIVAVLLLTLYNILPTIIYYLQPLKERIDEVRAEKIIDEASSRAYQISQESRTWVQSLCRTLQIETPRISSPDSASEQFRLVFKNEKEAEIFAKYVEAAGSTSIFLAAKQPFVTRREGKEIDLSLRIIYLPTPQEAKSSLFTFFAKRDSNGAYTQEFLKYVQSRFVDVAYAFSKGVFLEQELTSLARSLFIQQQESEKDIDQYIEAVSPYLASDITLALSPFKKEGTSYQSFQQKTVIATLYTLQQRVSQERGENASSDTLLSLRDILKSAIARRLESVQKKGEESTPFAGKIEAVLKEISSIPAQQLEGDSLKRWSKASISSWFNSQIEALAKKNASKKEAISQVIQLPLAFRHPLFSTIELDLASNTLEFIPSSDILSLFSMQKKNETTVDTENTVEKFIQANLYREASRVANETHETVQESKSGCIFEIPLFSASSPETFIALSTGELAKQMSKALLLSIDSEWSPAAKDFLSDAYPRYTVEDFIKADKSDRTMCVLAFSPASTTLNVGSFLKPTSLYVLLRGAKKIIDFNSNEAAVQDVTRLSQMLQARGFRGYSGEAIEENFGVAEFSSDIVFELENFYEPYVEATRENFNLYGQTHLALLEFTNVEARIRRENAIDDQIQDELLRWKDMWQSAQVSLNPVDRFLVPKPTQSAFWSNLSRGAKKYFRGDRDRTLKWGLDLSGGKSVKVGLYDSAMRPVTNEKDLRQAVSELYSRLNSMGVSERTIRVENDTISIDFPGTQEVSSSELVQASAMYFHVVNEKFGPFNKSLAKDVDLFLQEVWNEALLRNQKDIQSLNQIAYQKIQAVAEESQFSPSTKALIQAGLKFQNPEETAAPTTAFDDAISLVVKYKGEDPADWGYRSHPLLIVFRNYALEGANLQNVNPSYDATKGNILVFNVRSKDQRETHRNPQEEFYAWTSQYSQEAISGTIRDKYSNGRGWRMAVVLNGQVISDPTLSSPLKESAMITGNFSQREVQRLAKDLEAGSLSFTPKILSENNVSPELGHSERIKGISASILGIFTVVATMLIYYRFAGVVASIAVLMNLFIIWAVMQNIDAAMTLPALAGVVLTIGMAVDANVLVFERIREELKERAKLAYAIQAGYSRAFSAIVDSNLTTLIAAFILTQFDSGPIRGFALTLIIGVISSMFTSLFLTKYYFSRWIEKHPEKETLHMANWLTGLKTFDFFYYTRTAVVLTCLLVLAGVVSFAAHWKSMLGMDFTGGYALVVSVEKPSDGISPKEKASQALELSGLKAGEFQIRELGSPTLLRIQLSSGLEEEGRPFSILPLSKDAGLKEASYQVNPRIDWTVSALEKGGLTISAQEKEVLATRWSSISGQFSDAMRNNAVYALGLSLLAILIYIAVRFEWKYAISSVLALIHDVLVTLSALALFYLFGLNLQINLEVVGAIMTIIGYSLNDTIIVFDRVREDAALYRKKNFKELVNMALNSTLSRTVMTSSTTLAVLLCLVLFGGSSIFTFSFVMFVGVLLGTFSSLFIAAPLLVYFDKHEERE